MAERRAMIVVYVFVSMVRIRLETDGVPVGTGENSREWSFMFLAVVH